MSRDPWHDGREAWERLARRPRSGEEALGALSDIGHVRRLLDQAELEAVRAARRDRRSWAEIATRLGVSRQSAWERWKDLDEEPSAPAPRPRVTVPNVVGMSWPTAQHRLLEERLHPVIADPAPTPFLGPEAADFEVVDQKPTAGERVASHSPVTVWLHRGPGSAGVHAPLQPPPDPHARRGAIDEETGESVR
ncbi:PASTA domain-containing protein [Pseudonocardia adelaidensis]|uniref:PASTA domain-containing protein n=1 Tax=Pseudonocardia adelaidensis TaxID=648754 RepID=A0ABP9NIS8_9PSEU